MCQMWEFLQICQQLLKQYRLVVTAKMFLNIKTFSK
jgi:hypothetical protein